MLRVLPQSLSPDTPLPCMLLTVRLLALLVDDDTLAPRLCSHSGKAMWGWTHDCWRWRWVGWGSMASAEGVRAAGDKVACPLQKTASCCCSIRTSRQGLTPRPPTLSGFSWNKR